ncbi:3'-5' exoribonuclease HELZ2-like isoform X2 [Diadema antillarum]|uniref:3'-5' exoribonuclease HELZ2-like isoform X2 n=1 Tax=Diadema antillarum TaxID=105358 RepID=UPI003A85DDF2
MEQQLQRHHIHPRIAELFDEASVVVCRWRIYHDLQSERWILDFIATLQAEAEYLLKEGVKLQDTAILHTAARLFVDCLQLYNILLEDDYSGGQRHEKGRERAYIRHAHACILLANGHTGRPDCCVRFLQIAKCSVQNVSWECDERQTLTSVIEFKRALLSKPPSERVAAKLRECHHQLLRLAPRQMQVVLQYFNVWSASQLRQVVDEELEQNASIIQSTRNASTNSNDIDMDWIGEEHMKTGTKQKQKSKPGRRGSSSSQAGSTDTGQTACARRNNDPSLSTSSPCEQRQPGSAGRSSQDLGQPLSRVSIEWLEQNQFRLACKTCYTLKRNQDGVNCYSLNLNPAHGPKCGKDLLLCQLEKNGPSADSSTVYGLVRPRPKRAEELLCNKFPKGKCQVEDCRYSHSGIELLVWRAEHRGTFDRAEIMEYLMHHPSGLSKAVSSGVLSVTAKAQGGIRQNKAKRGGQQNPDPTKMEAVREVLKKIGGEILVLCAKCYDDRPHRISRPRASNPQICEYSKDHSIAAGQYLVHSCDGAYLKVRECPFRRQTKKIPLCWHINKTFGCRLDDKCSFAHSLAESELWALQLSHGIRMEELWPICSELKNGAHHNEGSALGPLSTKGASAKPQGSLTSDRKSRNQPQIASATRATLAPSCGATQSFQEHPAFSHTIKVVCGSCFDQDSSVIQVQDSKKKSYCSGKKRHAWGQYTVRVVWASSQGKWLRIFPRPLKLRPEIDLKICWQNKSCKRVFGKQCLFPHFWEELELWDYQKKYKVKSMKEVIDKQQHSQTASPQVGSIPSTSTPTMTPTPDSTAAPTCKYHCSYCRFSTSDQTQYEAHCQSPGHKARILSDSDRIWKYRSPPHADGRYKMCRENETGQCEFSGTDGDNNDCKFAHSVEELDEWRERHDYLIMKLDKAHEMKLFSWLDDLAHDIQIDEENAVTEDMYGMELEVNNNFNQTCVIPEEENSLKTRHQKEIRWDIILHAPEKRLKRVGLLYDQHRSQFFLSDPEYENQPQSCPGILLKKETNSQDYQLNVIFSSSRCGLFCQWLVFDFDERPCLVVKLSVNMGTETELKQLEFIHQEVAVSELWSETNCNIIRSAPPDSWTKGLMEKYPSPAASELQSRDGDLDVLRLNRENYKVFMHRMLELEERECMESLSRYKAVTDMEIMQTVQLSRNTLFAQAGELYGTIKLSQPLFNDSQPSRIFQSYVEAVLLKCNSQGVYRDEELTTVYEAPILSKEGSSNSVTVSLSPRLVQDWRLEAVLKGKPPAKVQVTMQFSVNRHWFLTCHYAVDNLRCMDTVLPPPNQPARFLELEEEMCDVMLNKRQKKAVRYICAAGTTHTPGPHQGPTMILGPFGTGKTHTLALAVQRTVDQCPQARILICTRSNSAADWYISTYLDSFCQERGDAVRMLRIYAAERRIAAVPEVVRKYCPVDAEGFHVPTDEELLEWMRGSKDDAQTGPPNTRPKPPNIVLATLTMAVHLAKTPTLRGYFTHIVIDEAGQVLEPEAIIPLGLATETTCVVLAGDPKQTNPMVHSFHALDAKFDMSLLQRLYKFDKQNKCQASCLLHDNYRSCQAILDFLKVHYGMTLKSRYQEGEEHPNLYPLNFVEVKGVDTLVESSYINLEEAREVVEKVASLIQFWPDEQWGKPKQSEIVVLSPYFPQVQLIRSEMKKRGLHAVTVETVQNVQGKQYRAVFISTVRTRSTLNNIDITAIRQGGRGPVRNRYWYGFLSDRGLLNTAFTRAKSLIVVIGDPVALCSVGECQKTWTRYIKTCEDKEGLLPNDLTFAEITRQIDAAKHLLNPKARPFNPRSKTYKSSQHYVSHNRGAAAISVTRAVAVPGCRQGSKDTGTLRDKPDVDAEELRGQEWLQDLREQMLEDERAEQRRSRPYELESIDDLDDTGLQEREGMPDMPQTSLQEPCPAHAQETPVAAGDRGREYHLNNLRMVERHGHVALLRRNQRRQAPRTRCEDAYASDDENDTGQHDDLHEGSVEQLLELTVKYPEKYKVCTFIHEVTGRMIAIPHDRQSGDVISITSMRRRGQALNTDKVVVEVMEDIEDEEYDDEANIEEDKMIYGKVTGIVERNGDLKGRKLVCYLDPHNVNIMVPVDRSCPKLFLVGKPNPRSGQCSEAKVTVYMAVREDAKEREDFTSSREVRVAYYERAQKLFVVQYLHWAKRTPYPFGIVTEELLPGDTQRSGLHILKLVHGIREEYTQVQREYPKDWTIPKDELMSRQDLRAQKVFTIDPPGSKDLDDAISIIQLPGNRYQIDVHIADVSYFITKDSALDKEAYERGTSFYHPFPVNCFHMLPTELSTRLCSLLPGHDRLAFTVRFVLDQDGQMVAVPQFFRSVIKSIRKLTYEETERIIQGSSHQGCEVEAQIRCLHRLAQQCRSHRLEDGWRIYQCEDDGGGAVCHPHAHSLIEELMLLANESVAKKILENFPECTPLRRQLAPSQEQVEAWKGRFHKAIANSVLLSMHADRSEVDTAIECQDNPMAVAVEVWREVHRLMQETEGPMDVENIINLVLQDSNHPHHALALSYYHRIMESAEYIDTTSQQGTDKRSHYSLKRKAYCHFTSPIRRYMDIIVHRMLAAAIEGSQSPYSPREMADITHHCNSQNARSKRFSKETLSLKLALKLKEAPLQTSSFIEGFNEMSMMMYLPYRSYVLSGHRAVAFSHLKPAEKPEVESEGVKLKWKTRMYDTTRRRIAVSPAKIEYSSPVVSIPAENWHAIIQAIKEGNNDGIVTAIQTADANGRRDANPFSSSTQDDRSDTQVLEMVSFERTYKAGDVCKLQMNSKVLKGLLVPQIQLFHISPKVGFCTEHRSSPVTCFARIARDIPGREKSITSYQNKWQEMLSMVTANSSIGNDDTVILQNVPIKWKENQGKISGYFELSEDFLEKHSIRIFVKYRVLNNEYHYLCVCIDRKVRVKSQLAISQYDKNKGSIGPFNRDAWSKQTIVAHCCLEKTDPAQVNEICGIKKEKSRRNREQHNVAEEEDVPLRLPVEFVIHQSSAPFPEDLLDDKRHLASSVEMILKPEPDRRLEQAIVALSKAPQLVKDIALQRPHKPAIHGIDRTTTTAKLLNLAKGIQNLRVPDTSLKPLNQSQQEAVKEALRSTFSVIQGPPGTGKTVTGAYLAYFFSCINSQLQTGDQRPQVLYCGPSNKSVDVVARYLKTFQTVSIVRVYGEIIERKAFPIPGAPGYVAKRSKNEADMPPDLADIALHYKIREEGKPYARQILSFERKLPNLLKSVKDTSQAYKDTVKDYKATLSAAMREELQQHDIVLCTCNVSGGFRIRTFTSAMQVIVDEAGMCSEPETMIPLVFNKPKQVVLIGDHKQLRSIITEPNAKALGMDVSLLEKYKDKAKMLTIQYRMHRRICEFPSSAFYDNKLQTDRSVTERSRDPLWRIWPNRGDTPRVFCHVSGREETLSVKSDEGSEMSKGNPMEIKHVRRIVREMVHHGAKAESIVVLSQYRLQCAHLTDELKTMGAPFSNIRVSTVVKSQGSEWDYVILSTVRSMPRIEIEQWPSKGWQRKHLGFINDENQMNVALTRAKRGLIIVGNMHLLQTHEQWRKMINIYRNTGCLKEAREFLPERS